MDERTVERYPSKDGTRIVVVTRWLDRQTHPPRKRTKVETQKLNRHEILYFEERAERLGHYRGTAGITESREPA